LRNLVEGTQFRRDVKLSQRRGKDMSKLRELIRLLMEAELPPPKYRDHPLGGQWKDSRDCHIEPDWVPIYKIDGNDLHLVRTGTHSDLFQQSHTVNPTTMNYAPKDRPRRLFPRLP